MMIMMMIMMMKMMTMIVRYIREIVRDFTSIYFSFVSIVSGCIFRAMSMAKLHCLVGWGLIEILMRFENSQVTMIIAERIVFKGRRLTACQMCF